MTPIEIMALVAAIIVPIKIIMLLRSHKPWFVNNFTLKEV
jgi:hypothetical protein